MTALVRAWEQARQQGRRLIVCDVSPPRGHTIDQIAAIGAIAAGFYCVAYAPGRAVRLDSMVMAALLKQQTARDAIFNLSTRDMNLLALQTHLLGARALGLENVVIVRGDEFAPRDRGRVTAVHDVSTTGLLAAVARMNGGLDFRDAALQAPAGLCAGATADPARDLDAEVRLTARKVHAGAQYLLTQPVYSPEQAERFRERYRQRNGESLDIPVLWGFAVLAKDSLAFGEIPPDWRRDLDAGRPGADLAAEQLDRFAAAGLTALYLLPPILRGGLRDYAAAAHALGGPAESL